MGNKVLGYVQEKSTKNIYPFVEQDENGYGIIIKDIKYWYNKNGWTEVEGPDEKDNINPDHYKVGGIETFDFMKAKLSKEALEGYCAGNVIKYVTRYSHKNGVEDLKKAQWYLSKMIQSMEGVIV